MSKILRIYVSLFCAVAVLYGVTGCKSKPDVKQEPPAPAKPAQTGSSAEQKTAEELLKELEKVRAEAIELKADTAYPAQFKTAEDAAAQAKSSFESKRFADSQKKAQQAITQYRTLINQMRIAAIKAKIDEHDLSAYDAESYKKAEELFGKIASLYDTDPSGAFETSEQALGYYESVANAGFAALMGDAKKKADEAKERCDSVKAAAAMSDDYTNTVNQYRKADIAAKDNKYEQAYNGYMAAAEEFGRIYEMVQKKRAQAFEAMKKAKARQDESSQLAKDADREAPLPEDAEGFSSEPIDIESLKLPAGNTGADSSSSSDASPSSMKEMQEEAMNGEAAETENGGNE